MPRYVGGNFHNIRRSFSIWALRYSISRSSSFERWKYFSGEMTSATHLPFLLISISSAKLLQADHQADF
ncbi:TPA: hypothetical protein HLT63_23995 [Escherichia coli]|nr:hypothetical protein [Escherichia coli]